MQSERASRTNNQAAAFHIGSADGDIVWFPSRYTDEGSHGIDFGQDPGKRISLDVWGSDNETLSI